MAIEEVKNLKIDGKNFRADTEVLYKTYRTAYPNRDEIEIIEKAQEVLARNHRSEMKRINIVGRADNRKTMMQCNFFKLKDRKESECNKKAGNCFACGSSGHRMKKCSKRGNSSLVKKEVRRVNKVTSNGGLLIEMKMLNDNSEVSSHLSFLDSGSDVTFISFDLSAALNLKLNPSKDLVHVGNSSEL
uniref:CCHC-type domain-containing protein n=1 Tax=Strongyloides venezuelensis TaxID=75913 RepID=A0A0K0FFP7_STRVS